MTAPARHLTSFDAVFGAGCHLRSVDSGRPDAAVMGVAYG